MEYHVSADKLVTKYIHNDKSETCIKTVPSLEYRFNGDGGVEMNAVDRGKFSLFLSDSAGCPMSCKFCYLTLDDMPFKKVQNDAVINNGLNALYNNPDVPERYIKVCWMGMGEPILRSNSLQSKTLCFIGEALTLGSPGLDGVDISTVLPKLKGGWVDDCVTLNDSLKVFKINPATAKPGRSPFRLFFSLHSAIQETRDYLIPNAMPLKDVVAPLSELKDRGVNVIIHHMFLDGVNDTQEELDALATFMESMPGCELRILRYNHHESKTLVETSVFEACICYLNQKGVSNIKVQVSQGKDIQSACGQFIYNRKVPKWGK